MRLLAICLAFLASCGQEPTESPKPSAPEVRQACEAWAKAYNACNAAMLERPNETHMCQLDVGVRPAACEGMTL